MENQEKSGEKVLYKFFASKIQKKEKKAYPTAAAGPPCRTTSHPCRCAASPPLPTAAVPRFPAAASPARTMEQRKKRRAPMDQRKGRGREKGRGRGMTLWS